MTKIRKFPDFSKFIFAVRVKPLTLGMHGNSPGIGFHPGRADVVGKGTANPRVRRNPETASSGSSAILRELPTVPRWRSISRTPVL